MTAGRKGLPEGASVEYRGCLASRLWLRLISASNAFGAMRTRAPAGSGRKGGACVDDNWSGNDHVRGRVAWAAESRAANRISAPIRGLNCQNAHWLPAALFIGLPCL